MERNFFEGCPNVEGALLKQRAREREREREKKKTETDFFWRTKQRQSSSGFFSLTSLEDFLPTEVQCPSLPVQRTGVTDGLLPQLGATS